MNKKLIAFIEKHDVHFHARVHKVCVMFCLEKRGTPEERAICHEVAAEIEQKGLHVK
jgi:hypothetical protein